VVRKDYIGACCRIRRRLAQYGLCAILCPVTLVSAADLADVGTGDTAVATAAGTPEEPPPSMFTFGAFGTLGVVHSDQPLADFTSSRVEGSGAGYTRTWSAAVDSLVGAQVDARLTRQLSAVLQVISEQNADSGFTPHIEWAYLKYQCTPDFSIRLGRTALDAFLLTDSRNIGFAYPWVRPPIELYDLVPVTNSDGIDFNYRFAAAGGSNTIDAVIGYTRYQYPYTNSQTTGTANAHEQFSLVDTFQRGPATLRLTYGQAHLTVAAFEPLFDAFGEFGPQGVGIADRYDVDDRVIAYYGLSGAYEPGQWFLMAELGRVNFHSVLGEATGWYVSSGYRFGNITPYATYAQTRPNSNTRDPGLDLSALPPSLAAEAGALNAELNAALATFASQRTLSLGARLDVTSSIDLKLQWDRTNLGANSQGWLTNLQPGFQLGSSFTLVSATLNFVF
jgi:hypothetical protein